MKNLRRGVVALICTAVAVATAGCNSKSLAIPVKFCHIPVKKTSLAPLIPNGKDLTQTYADLDSQPGTTCTMKVDGHQILFATVVHWDRSPEPVNWTSVASPYKNAAKRKVSFPGDAVIGSDHAVVQATCNAAASYLSFDIYFAGERVEDTPEGYRKLQRFVEDFVPNETKKWGCTG
ncbi:hypothetical protein ACIQ6K_12025 [Streptomyces sp. NPDC096354]|uniref:hypothetical protein n=1 Tax=Streptomyces sp. NPDC096354 TaxID=3366088 RepID=UPI003804FE80